MKVSKLGLLGLIVMSVSANAQPRHDQQRREPAARAPRAAAPPRGREAGPRTRGVIARPRTYQPVDARNNAPHANYFRDEHGREQHHAVIYEHRPGFVVERDPHVRIMVRGYHPRHEWGHFHPAYGGWFGLWGIRNWDVIGTVTCEAANESSGELYPVAADRDARGWDDATVDSLLDQALDDCAADAGAQVCVPAQPACTFQSY